MIDPRVWTDWGTIVLIPLAVGSLVMSVWCLFAWGGAETRGLWANTAILPVIATASLLSFRAAFTRLLDRRSRQAWGLIGVSLLLYTLGDSLWMYYENVLGVDPFITWTDVAYLSYYPIFLLGILRFPVGPRSRGEKVQFWLDTATVMLGGWMIMWYFVLGPTAHDAGASWLESAVAVAYPVGDLVLLGAATIAMLRRWEPHQSRILTMLAAGCLLYVVADTGWGYQALNDRYVSGTWPDSLWFLAALVIAISAQLQAVCACRRPADAPVQEASVPPFSVLPYFAVALSYGLLLMVSHHEAAGLLAELIYSAVGVTGLVVVRQMIMARENVRLMADSAARRSESRFVSLVRNSSDLITIVDATLTITYISPSVERIFGYAPGDLIGKRLGTLLHPNQVNQVLNNLQQMMQHPGTSRLVEWQWFHRDGSGRYTETTVNNLLDDPNVEGLVLNTRDITERKQLEEQIRHQAFHDALTTLANRALFKDRVEQAFFEQGQRKEPFHVLFLDLDSFKMINDSMGHNVGDQLLVAVADRLRGCVRPVDTVARLGGDEFAILLKWMKPEDALQIANRIVTQLQAPFFLGETEMCVSASIGIASSSHGSQTDELLRNADVAMYCAKGRGKGRCEVFHPSMYSRVRERQELEAELRRAIDGDQFVLHYQPAVVLETGRIDGMEALVRWVHPTRGLIPPGQFIALAEETELIIPIGQWVLREACRQVKAWQDQYPTNPPISVAVNLSVQQLRQPDLVAQVQQALRDSGLQPESLTLEITESILMQGTEAFLETLRTLRALGVRLAIDDFGTGYSSLSYLRWFPVDILKIDRSFVQGIESSAKGVSLVNGIINLAQALGLSTIAEGIERAEQMLELQALQCQLGQGYYFGRPKPAAEMESLLSEAALREQAEAPESESLALVR